MPMRAHLLSLAVSSLLVGCAAGPRVALQPSALPQLLPEEPCVPVEYVMQAKQPGELVVDVQLDELGRAQRVDSVLATGLTDRRAADGLYIVRHAFHCRHRLARDAPHVVLGYKLRFVDRDLHTPDVDAAACGRAAEYPSAGLARGMEAHVPVGVTLDERGLVEQAWPVVGRQGDPYGFGAAAARALARGCRFTPALLDGKPVPFFLVYTFEFQLPRGDR